MKALYRIVLDTNVLISAIVFGGKPRKVFDLIIRGEVKCFISTSIIEELFEVLQRPKFSFSFEEAYYVTEELQSICKTVKSTSKINIITSDPDDNRILECAVKSKAHYIISGDSDLLELSSFKNILIVTPAEFLKIIPKIS